MHECEVLSPEGIICSEKTVVQCYKCKKYICGEHRFLTLQGRHVCWFCSS